jgi:hypothetical protein
MSIFRTPKMQSNTPPNPDDLQNTRDTERRNRLATGGSQSTLMAKAMAAASGQPTNTLTGVQS